MPESESLPCRTTKDCPEVCACFFLHAYGRRGRLCPARPCHPAISVTHHTTPPDLGLTLDEAEGHFHCLAYHRLSQLLRLTGSFVGFQWMSLTAWAAETIIQPFLLKNMSRFRPITRNGDILSSAEPP